MPQKKSDIVPTRAAVFSIKNYPKDGPSRAMSTGTKRAKAKKRGPNLGIKRISQEGQGLWIDREFLRRHMNPVPKFVNAESTEGERDLDRYLELADTLLSTNTEKQQRDTN